MIFFGCIHQLLNIAAGERNLLPALPAPDPPPTTIVVLPLSIPMEPIASVGRVLDTLGPLRALVQRLIQRQHTAHFTNLESECSLVQFKCLL
jgi:hypothetical protein